MQDEVGWIYSHVTEGSGFSSHYLLIPISPHVMMGIDTQFFHWREKKKIASES